MKLLVETDAASAPGTLPGDGAHLVAFMSFAVSRGFGATHPLIALADRLHDQHVRLGPLTTFYEAPTPGTADAEDATKLDLAWQPATHLVASLEQLLAALTTDERAHTLLRRGEAEDLPCQAEALLDLIRPAAASGQRVRLSYVL